MKKRLLWILIITILIIGVASFIFFNMRDKEHIENIGLNQEDLPYYGIVKAFT